MHRTKTIALATCDKFHELLTDDDFLRDELSKLGYRVPSVSWSDPTVDWTSYDAVIIRSTWDYFHHLPDFLGWMQMLEKNNVPTWNSPSIMRWNANKTYLCDLDAKGVNIVPTIWIDQSNNKHLTAILQTSGWEKAVLKPCVSGGSFLTVTVDASNAEEHQSTLEKILQTGTAMLQPFLPEIQSVGEYSFLFFGGEYQFTVLKSPKDGDYRVQQEYGGNTVKVNPSEQLLAAANQVMEAVGQPTLYARVDGVEVDGQLMLMELELIEPFLFLEYQEGAAEKLAKMIDERVRR